MLETRPECLLIYLKMREDSHVRQTDPQLSPTWGDRDNKTSITFLF